VATICRSYSSSNGSSYVLSLVVQQLAPIAEQLGGVEGGLREIAGKLTGAEAGGSGW